MFVILATLFASALARAANPCPEWQLSWGTYTGALDGNNVCLYSDVRFAAPATGDGRFAAPGYPPADSSPAAPGSDMSCIQASVNQGLGEILPGTQPNSDAAPYGYQDEDCLFLDVYIPPSAFSATSPIPVVVWFFGGGYLVGSKTAFDPTQLPFYVGDAFVNKASQPMIFVAGNYRLGAFGWLAGSYMQQNGQPNAGLLDQRTILRFVNDYLHTLALPNQSLTLGSISVWGESAGASSIMHHLAMPLNIETPLFQKAILQSPAYQWLWNADNFLDDTYDNFARSATSDMTGSCANSTEISCLRAADTQSLIAANEALFENVVSQGNFPVGPSVDDNLIPGLAPTRFDNKATVMSLESIAVSHADTEVPPSYDTSTRSFIPLPIREDPTNEAVFEKFVGEVFFNDTYPDIVQSILNRYPNSSYTDQVVRASAVIEDSSFLCNTRFIIDRYLADDTPVYAMDYAVGTSKGAAVHASDLLPAFANAETNYAPFIISRFPKLAPYAQYISNYITKTIGPQMQTFFVGLAIWSDPNHDVGLLGSKWQPATTAPCPNTNDTSVTCVWNLMKPDIALRPFGNNKGADAQTNSAICDFWLNIANTITPPPSSTSNGKLPWLGSHDDGQTIIYTEL